MNTSKIEYTYAKMKKLYGFNTEKSSIIHAADTEKIPKPHIKKTKDNRIRSRYWTTNELPEIGKKYGFLSQAKKRNVICVYSPKGGVLKTTFTHNFARALALHGIKTLIIGLDQQCNISGLTLGNQDLDEINNLEQLEETIGEKIGIGHVMRSKDQRLDPLLAIQKTDIPTLDIIEETPELISLSKSMVVTTRSENLFKKKVINYIDEAMEKQNEAKYDVIIFDNSPSWSPLTQAALFASNIVITPAGCDPESYRSLKICLNTINDFKENAEIDWWDDFILVPTLYERSNISKMILKAYRKSDANDQVTDYQISRASAGPKAALENLSVIEHSPKETLANEYRDIFEEIWNERINK